MTQIRITWTTATAFAVLTLAIIGALLLPVALTPRGATALGPGGKVVRLTGKLWDFPQSHDDMHVTPSDGFGEYTGLVSQTLGANGNPTFDGPGRKVLSRASDAIGNPIAAFMANRGGGINNFTIVDGQVIVHEEFEALVQVLGVDIASIPITFQVLADHVAYEPFGAYDDPRTGNINDELASGTAGNGTGPNPRHYLLPSVFQPGTRINVAGQSWKGSWETRLRAESIVDSQQVIVLRDGDPVPDIDPYGDQQPLAVYIADYVDEANNTIDLEPYQVIYLYELYTTDMNAATADFQDMVVLLSLARPEAIITADGQVLGCGPNNDTTAILSDTLSNGGIQSADTFGQWFSDVLGTNQSARTSLDLYEQPDGTYLFDDRLDPKYRRLGGYYPADGRALGGGGGHNDFFTTKFEAMFTYDALAEQFLEITSDGDVWVFIDDQLVIDMGGVHGALTQRVDLSRLCLNHGDLHKLTVFRAQRYSNQSRFRVWTNLLFQAVAPPTVTGQFD